jgi:hypothetical protein
MQMEWNEKSYVRAGESFSRFGVWFKRQRRGSGGVIWPLAVMVRDSDRDRDVDRQDKGKGKERQTIERRNRKRM